MMSYWVKRNITFLRPCGTGMVAIVVVIKEVSSCQEMAQHLSALTRLRMVRRSPDLSETAINLKKFYIRLRLL